MEALQALSLMLPCIIIISSAQKLNIMPRICSPSLLFTFPAWKILIYSFLYFGNIHLTKFTILIILVYMIWGHLVQSFVYPLLEHSRYPQIPFILQVPNETPTICQSPVIHAILLHLHTDLGGWNVVHF